MKKFKITSFLMLTLAGVINACGVTMFLAPVKLYDSGIQAVGGYSGTEKTVIYFVLNRFQISKMKDIVHEADSTAYITINEVADVFKSNM